MTRNALIALLLLFSLPLHAVEWNDLSAKQQEVLAPYESQWQQYSQERQQQLATGGPALDRDGQYFSQRRTAALPELAGFTRRT